MSESSAYTTDPPPSRWRLVRRTLLLVALAGTLTLAWGWQRRPALPRGGEGARTNTGAIDERPARSIRVAAFNIRSGKGTDGVSDLSRTASMLGSFDLVGLNELRGFLRGSPANQAEELGAAVESPWIFAPSERQLWHDDFGNGLLARRRVERYQLLPLPGTQSSGYRTALLARVPLADGVSVNVVVTHLDRVIDRAAQFRFVTGLFLSLEPPAILMGDLNTPGDDPLMRAFLTESGVTDAIGDTDALPAAERIDWILTRGLSTTEAGVVPTVISDHPLVWATLTLPTDATPVEANPPRPARPMAEGPVFVPATLPATRGSTSAPAGSPALPR